jgi:hypothetical protein
MEKNTRILIGVGIAAVAAYFVYRNRKSGSTTGNGKKCPEGFVYSQIKCIKAPCPEGECVPLESIPPKDSPKAPQSCPEGQKLVQVQCIKAPCPAMCVPDDGTHLPIPSTGLKPPPFFDESVAIDYPVDNYYSKPVLCDDGTYDYWKLGGGKPCQGNVKEMQFQAV